MWEIGYYLEGWVVIPMVQNQCSMECNPQRESTLSKIHILIITHRLVCKTKSTKIKLLQLSFDNDTIFYKI